MCSNKSRRRSSLLQKGNRDLVKSISKCNWDTVLEILPQITDFSDIEYTCSNCSKHHNLLHYILQFNPPFSVIKKIIEYLPNSLDEKNCVNRYPLHNALFFGTSYKVVKYLMKENSRVVPKVDSTGKNLLHLAIDGYELLRLDAINDAMALEYLTEIIDALYVKEPSLIVTDTIDVVEYAIEKDLDPALIKRLKALRKSYAKSFHQEQQPKQNFRPRRRLSFVFGAPSPEPPKKVVKPRSMSLNALESLDAARVSLMLAEYTQDD